jgi:hypothetical protein
MKMSLYFYILWVLLFQYSIAIPIEPGQHPPAADPDRSTERPILRVPLPQYRPSGPTERPGFDMSSLYHVTAIDPQRVGEYPTVDSHHRYQHPPQAGPSHAGAPPVNHGESEIYGLPGMGIGKRRKLNPHVASIDLRHHHVGQQDPAVTFHYGNPHPPQAGPSHAGAPPVNSKSELYGLPGMGVGKR